MNRLLLQTLRRARRRVYDAPQVALDTHAGAAAMFDSSKSSVVRKTVVALLSLSTALPMTATFADQYSEASTIFNRITGTPPSASVLQQMATDISGNNAIGAAQHRRARWRTGDAIEDRGRLRVLVGE